LFTLLDYRLQRFNKILRKTASGRRREKKKKKKKKKIVLYLVMGLITFNFIMYVISLETSTLGLIVLASGGLFLLQGWLNYIEKQIDKAAADPADTAGEGQEKQ